MRFSKRVKEEGWEWLTDVRSNEKIVSREERVESRTVSDDIRIWREPYFLPGFSSLHGRTEEGKARHQ